MQMMKIRMVIIKGGIQGGRMLMMMTIMMMMTVIIKGGIQGGRSKPIIPLTST